MIRYRLVNLGAIDASVRVVERVQALGVTTIVGSWHTARLEPVALLFTRDGRELALDMNGEPLEPETVARWLAASGAPPDVPSKSPAQPQA